MTKIQFIVALSEALSGLPKDEIEERLAFYSEMIDDRMEDGLSEADAVAEIGSVEEIAAQVMEEIPLTKIVKNKVKPKRKLRVWEIVLLALGSPIWLSLAVAAAAVIVSLYAVLWSVVVVTLWAVFVAIAASGAAGVIAGIGIAIFSSAFSGLSLVSAGLICGGLSIFLFYGALGSTRGAVWLTKKIALIMKRCLIRKEDAE